MGVKAPGSQLCGGGTHPNLTCGTLPHPRELRGPCPGMNWTRNRHSCVQGQQKTARDGDDQV